MTTVTDNQLPLVREWYAAKDKLKEVQDHERQLRKQVLEAIYGEPQKGTHKCDLPNGMELVLSVGAKISVDKDEFMKHKVHMEKKGLIGEESVIKLKPEVSATAYKYLSAEDKAAFDSVFKHSLTSPQLDVRQKKG